MTFRTTISSKGKPSEFLKKGFKSMFANYDDGETKAVSTQEKQGDQQKKHKA